HSFHDWDVDRNLSRPAVKQSNFYDLSLSMEFLSPKTKERISKLEAENKSLRLQLEQQDTTAKTMRWPFLVIAVLLIAIAAVWKNSKTSPEELSAIQVEMWQNGSLKDTVLYPTFGIEYSIQVGAFNELDYSELSSVSGDLKVQEENGVQRILLGSFTNLPQAQLYLEKVVKIGFENAFIVAYKEGIAVGLLPNKTAIKE
ncbi:SPOR domain-containing protein, partial [Schleiferiaceae bacterium]|nr:SPOR domain-containing protein [Schleiferiaceae bacterium]